jgi:hypothetical protein
MTAAYDLAELADTPVQAERRARRYAANRDAVVATRLTVVQRDALDQLAHRNGRTRASEAAEAIRHHLEVADYQEPIVSPPIGNRLARIEVADV